MAYFLFRGGTDGSTLVAAAIGSAMMVIWSLTTTAPRAALSWRRGPGCSSYSWQRRFRSSG